MSLQHCVTRLMTDRAAPMATVLSVHFGPVRGALLTCSIALAAAGGLLLMHGLSIVERNADKMDVTHMKQVADSAGVRVMPAHPDASMRMSDHLHRLLGCLWLVAAGITMAFANGLRHRVAPGRIRLIFPVLIQSSTQRAPPVAVRLSLVGISRR
jgi:hypothetical protein